MAAITRKDLNKTTLYKYKVCSKCFISGKPIYLYNKTNPDWLPTLNLDRHRNVITKILSSSDAVHRWKRNQEREKWKRIKEVLPILVTEDVNTIITEEVILIALKNRN